MKRSLNWWYIFLFIFYASLKCECNRVNVNTASARFRQIIRLVPYKKWNKMVQDSYDRQVAYRKKLKVLIRRYNKMQKNLGIGNAITVPVFSKLTVIKIGKRESPFAKFLKALDDQMKIQGGAHIGFLWWCGYSGELLFNLATYLGFINNAVGKNYKAADNDETTIDALKSAIIQMKGSLGIK